jgi:hypothetical protein
LAGNAGNMETMLNDTMGDFFCKVQNAGNAPGKMTWVPQSITLRS